MALPAVLAAFSALSGLWQSALNYNAQIRTNEANADLASQANQWQIQNRDYENWYNSPEGLRARGLNPALSMSASGANLAQSADAGAANVPTFSAPKFQSGIESIPLQAAQVESQIKLNESIAAKNYSEIPVNKQMVTLYEQTASTYKAQQQLYTTQALKENEQFQKLLNENNLFYETWNDRVAEWNAKGSVARWEAKFAYENAIARLQYNQERVTNLIADTRNKDANTELSRAYKDLSESQKREVDQLISNLEQIHEELVNKVALLKKQAELIEKYGDAKEVTGMINSTLSALANVEHASAYLISTIMSKGQAPNFTVPYSNSSVSQY